MTRAPQGLPPTRQAQAIPEKMKPQKFANCLAGPDLERRGGTPEKGRQKEFTEPGCVY